MADKESLSREQSPRKIVDAVDHNDIQMVRRHSGSRGSTENLIVHSDDVPIEINKRSGCELCKSLIGAAAGNFLEWFDFAIFGTFIVCVLCSGLTYCV